MMISGYTREVEPLRSIIRVIEVLFLCVDSLQKRVFRKWLTQLQQQYVLTCMYEEL